MIPEAYCKRIGYKDIPVTLLGRLAVHKNYKGEGLGKHLLLDALHRSYRISASIASMAVVVDPINESETFYAKYGFIKLPDSNRMFLQMRTIAKLFTTDPP